MRIQTHSYVLLNCSTITATAQDDYVITVVATGLDPRGDTRSVTIELTRNELTCINSAASRKMVRL